MCLGYVDISRKPPLPSQSQEGQPTPSLQQEALILSASEPQQKTNATRTWTACLSSPAADEDDSHLLQYFTLHAPSSLGGILDAKFWTVVVPRVSYSWESVRYALMALSALIRYQNTTKVYHSNDQISSRLAYDREHILTGVRLYSKALKHAAEDITEHSGRRDIAGLTCVIFFCIECIQGHYIEAARIFQHAQNVLAPARQSSTGAYYQSAELTLTVVRMFSRIRLAMSLRNLISVSDTRASIISESLDNRFTGTHYDVCTARAELNEIMAESHSLWLYSLHLGDEGTDTCTQKRRDNLFARLQSWQERSIGLLDTELCLPGSYEHQASHILWCHYWLICIWLDCALSDSETIFESHLETFRNIVRFAAELIRTKTSKLAAMPEGWSDDTVAGAGLSAYASFPFQLETGVLLPLYMTACNCRCPSLRQEALFWLRQGPAQEGFLRRDHLVSATQRLLDIEMNECGAQSWAAQGDRIVHHTIEKTSCASYLDGQSSHSIGVRFYRRRRDGSIISWREDLPYDR